MPSRSRPHLPVPEIAVPRCVLGRTETRRGRPALIDGASGRKFTYHRLDEAVRAAASGLVETGLRQGDVVAVHLPDTPELAVATYAVIAAGGTATLIRPSSATEAVAHQLADTGARMLISWSVLLDVARAAADSAPVERIFAVGGRSGAGPGVEPFARLLDGPARWPEPPLDPARDLALVPYTRGTCGPPKGIELTHHNVVAGLRQFVDAAQIGEADVVLSGIELTDIMGLTTVLNPALYAGAAVVTRIGGGRGGLLQALHDHRVTVALLTPAQAGYLARGPATGRYDFGSLRTVITTGAPLSPATARALRSRLGCTVRQGYGQAETGGLTHLYLSAEEDALDSVGPALSLTESRVTAPSGEIQPAYEPGEVWVRGPVVARRTTAATSVSAGGWLRTGDVGFTDQHGRLYLVGRTRTATSRQDRSEAAMDPRAVLRTHPAVDDAAVIAMPGLSGGVVAHAFVVLRSPVEAGELLSYVTSRAVPYQRVEAVHVVDEIPRSAAGGVRRRQLLELARESGQGEDRDDRGGDRHGRGESHDDGR